MPDVAAGDAALVCKWDVDVVPVGGPVQAGAKACVKAGYPEPISPGDRGWDDSAARADRPPKHNPLRMIARQSHRKNLTMKQNRHLHP